MKHYERSRAFEACGVLPKAILRAIELRYDAGELNLWTRLMSVYEPGLTYLPPARLNRALQRLLGGYKGAIYCIEDLDYAEEKFNKLHDQNDNDVVNALAAQLADRTAKRVEVCLRQLSRHSDSVDGLLLLVGDQSPAVDAALSPGGVSTLPLEEPGWL